MNLKQFREKMKSGEISAGSKLAMRNEAIQTNKRTTYERLKKEKGKVCKLVIPKELALDFDPEVGESTEEFNAAHKFRPLLVPSTMALILKEIADNNEKTKERFMAKAGVEAWDTSDCTTLTAEDKKVFTPYLYPVIYTLPVVNVKLKAMTTTAWGRDYLMRIKRDPITNKVEGETPLPLQANYFFRALAAEECDELESKVRKGEIDLSDKQLSEKKSDIRGARILVSSDKPSNWVRLLEIPLNEDMSLKDAFNAGKMTAESVNDYIRITRCSSELMSSLQKFKSTWKAKDTNFDFYEVDMVCPVDKDDPMLIGKDTRYEKTDCSLISIEGYDTFLAAYKKRFDNDEDAEKLMWASTGITEYNEDIEKRLMESLEMEIDLESPYLTEKVIKNNANFLQMVFPDESDEMIMSAEGGFSGRKAGNFDPGKEQAEYDLEKMSAMDDLDLEELSE